MKKNYVAPQIVAFEVAIESEVFAGSPLAGTQNNGFFTPTGTTTPTTGGSSSASIATSRGASSLSGGQQSENEIYDELVSFD